MRIGTWNLEGRATDGHVAALEAQRCDVWLLTEVPVRFRVPGQTIFLTAGRMATDRAWAAVSTTGDGRQLPDPHPASAAVELDGVVWCSSVLPWRTCGSEPPWRGTRHGEKMQSALAELDAALPAVPLVWGGDWNNALIGPEYAGSLVGRAALSVVIARRRLRVPTAQLASRSSTQASIDHVAVNQDLDVVSVERFDGSGLSDHDGYVVEIATSADAFGTMPSGGDDR